MTAIMSSIAIIIGIIVVFVGFHFVGKQRRQEQSIDVKYSRRRPSSVSAALFVFSSIDSRLIFDLIFRSSSVAKQQPYSPSSIEMRRGALSPSTIATPAAIPFGGGGTPSDTVC